MIKRTQRGKDGWISAELWDSEYNKDRFYGIL